MKNRLALVALACFLPMVSFAQSAKNDSPTARAPSAPVTLVNLNTADAATLARDMDGIGASKAQAIVEHRKSKGAFRSVDELALVKGIGSKTLERNRPRLTVGNPPPAAGAKPAPTSPSKATPVTKATPATKTAPAAPR